MSYAGLVGRADAFLARDIPPRTWLVEGAIPHPSLGMLYAWRGTAKTYTAMRLALDVAAGVPWMCYGVPQPRTVLYVDGEMPIGDMHERLTHLSRDTPAEALERLWVLASEDLACAHETINLARPEARARFARTLAEVPAEFIILDNWTSLVRGIDENDNASLDAIKEWLILLRHGERSVLVVHHAGKTGAQRGASAREDNLDYSITIEAEGEGADTQYCVWWDKTRTGKPQPERFNQKLVEDDGTIQLIHVGPPPAEIIADYYGEHPDASLRDAEAALGIPRSTIHRLKRRGTDVGQ